MPKLIVCFRMNEGRFKVRLAFLEGLILGIRGSAKGAPLELKVESGFTLSLVQNRAAGGCSEDVGQEASSLPWYRVAYLGVRVKAGYPCVALICGCITGGGRKEA